MKVKKARKKKVRDWKRIRPRLIYLLFLVATIVFVSVRGGAFSYALFYAALLYPPLAFFYLLYVRVVIRIQEELPLREIKKKTEEEYLLVLENAGLLPISGVRLTTEVGTVFREDMTGEEVSLFPREKKEFSTALSCKYAGSYNAGIASLRFRDCFGLIELRMKNRNPLRVQVLPVVTSEAERDMDHAIWELAHGASGNRREKEDTLGNDMARYTPGDPIKRIHWKNYARSGELFVRLPEEKDYRMYSVVLFAHSSEEGEEGLISRDRFLEYAVSVAGIFANHKQPVQFLYYNTGVKTVVVEGFDGMQGLCHELSKELMLRGDEAAVEKQLTEEAGRQNCPALYIREGENQLCPM